MLYFLISKIQSSIKSNFALNYIRYLAELIELMLRNKGLKYTGIWLWIFLSLLTSQAISQTYDTICNWDGITLDWDVSTPGSQIIINPHQEGINLSEHCFDVITGTGMYDYMISNMPEPVNFDYFPIYSLKVYSPPGGGDVVLKFENIDNTASQELRATTIPGQWNNLEYNFSGLEYDNLTRMVIFFDFLGTTAGIHWYIDDILSVIPVPLELQTNLPIVVINTSGVSIPDEPKITAHMGIIDNGTGNINNLTDPYNNYDGSIGIEIRGQSTQMFPKKAYAVETRDNTGGNLDVSLLGMPEENDWILYAPYTDKSMLRNVVSFDMGRKMGEYCTRTVYCELVINNDYKGVYVLMEKIKKDKNRVDIATLNPEEITGDDLTGGYILKVDKLDYDFSYATDGWKSNPSPPYPNAMDIIFQYYYPDPAEIVTEQRVYIKNYITTAENNLCSSGFADPDVGYQKYFDAPSFVDFMLLSELSKEVDKYRYSNYFYKEKDSDGGKLFAGPVWDFNLGYGNVDYWSPGIDYTGWIYPTVSPNEYSIMFWWKRFMEDPYFRDLTKTRWVNLRQDKLSDANITSVIDSILILTDTAKDRNYERWPILGQYVWPNYNWQYNTYNDEVAYFENFLFNRLSWMDYNLTGNILHPWIGISAQANKIKLNLYGDYFSRPILKSKHFKLNDAPGGMTIQGIEYISASECRLTLSSDATGLSGLSVTVSEKIINTFQDLTSNKLGTAGFGVPSVSFPEISVFEAYNEIHILCNQPESLPENVEILNIAGQNLGIFTIEKTPVNIIPHHLQPGIYLIVINTESKTQVHRLAILK
jgi:hypothetical protein